MSENIYFEGDPSTDSARRHLERVLNEPPHKPRRWPWVLAAVAGATAWYFWPRGTTRTTSDRSAPEEAANR